MTAAEPTLPPERVAEMAEALAAATGCDLCDGTGRNIQGWTDKSGVAEAQYGPCPYCTTAAQAVAPLIAGWLAEAEGLHRDLVSRLGFGDNITEPMADNDTIVEWFEDRSAEAGEWVESQLWRNDCHAKGHPDDDDCFECDPMFAYERGKRDGAAEVRARMEAAIRLVSPDHITPMGARQILAALATEPEEQP